MTDRNAKTAAQRALESVLAAESGAIAVSEMQALAEAAKAWARTHTTSTTQGAPGYTQPPLTEGSVLRLERTNPDQWAGSFDVMLGALLTDVLEAMEGGGAPLWGEVIAYQDERTDLVTRYSGTITMINQTHIHFYDGVTVPRELVVAVGV